MGESHGNMFRHCRPWMAAEVLEGHAATDWGHLKDEFLKHFQQKLTSPCTWINSKRTNTRGQLGGEVVALAPSSRTKKQRSTKDFHTNVICVAKLDIHSSFVRQKVERILHSIQIRRVWGLHQQP